MHTPRFIGAIAALTVLLTGTAHPAPPQAQQTDLPAPSGPYPVGRTVFRWVDSMRPEAFAATSAARRNLTVYLWYPSRAGGGAVRAAYLPQFAALGRAVGDSALRRLLGASYDAVRTGRLRAHAVENAPLATARRHPLLIFSPGFAESALTYATVLEDLASHGYVVAALDHPFDALGVATSGGAVIPFASRRWQAALAAGPDSVLGYFKARVTVWAADSRFALDALTRGARLPGAARPLADHLDPARIGAFGHSLGGLATVRLCQLDARVRACVNQDSDYRGIPLLDFADGSSLRQPFMFMASDHSLILAKHRPPPTPADLAASHLTRAEYDAKLRRQQAAQDSTLGHLRGGSYRVGIETPGFTHRSFMDAPLLQLTPGSAGAAGAAARLNLTIVRTYTRAFFDRYLEGVRGGALDAPTPLDSAVTVQHFPSDPRAP